MFRIHHSLIKAGNLKNSTKAFLGSVNFEYDKNMIKDLNNSCHNVNTEQINTIFHKSVTPGFYTLNEK